MINIYSKEFILKTLRSSGRRELLNLLIKKMPGRLIENMTGLFRLLIEWDQKERNYISIQQSLLILSGAKTLYISSTKTGCNISIQQTLLLLSGAKTLFISSTETGGGGRWKK